MISCPHCGGEVPEDPPSSSQRVQCPACKQYAIVDLSSMNMRFCGSCHAEYDWHLKPKQKSVLIKGLVGEDSG